MHTITHPDATWIPYELKYMGYKRYLKKHEVNKGTVLSEYAGKPMLSCGEFNEKLYNAITEGIPYMVSRIGGNEMNVIAYTYRNRYFPYRTDARADNIRDLCVGAGFFPREVDYGEQFTDLMSSRIEKADILGIWTTYMEEWFIHRYAPLATSTWFNNLGPWVQMAAEGGERVWTKALQNKKVLVIHPFEDSIVSQYKKREQLFTGKFEGMLPEFELKTFKALQSMGGEGIEGFGTWFDALYYMQDEIDKIDYDVAIIGCGAYGLPLAAHVKGMGKCAIHMGGTVQLLFGIRGKRWDNAGSMYTDMMTDAWVRPLPSEIPEVMKKLENGCYC